MKYTDIKEININITNTIYECQECKAQFYGVWRDESYMLNEYPNYCPSCGCKIENIYEK